MGSVQDRVLRQFLLKRASKEVSKNKILAYAAMALANLVKNPEPIVREISGVWNDYVNQELYLEKVKEELENEMREEFDFWRKTKPKLNISKDGKLELSVSSLKPVN